MHFKKTLFNYVQPMSRRFFSAYKYITSPLVYKQSFKPWLTYCSPVHMLGLLNKAIVRVEKVRSHNTAAWNKIRHKTKLNCAFHRKEAIYLQQHIVSNNTDCNSITQWVYPYFGLYLYITACYYINTLLYTFKTIK